MKVCVLQPDYTASSVDYRHYDPRRDLSSVFPDDEVHHVYLDKRTTYRQLKATVPMGFDIYVNLCEGYLDWDVPSIDVIHALDQLGLPYTGPSATLYDPSKVLMKYVAHTAGLRTPAHRLVQSLDDLREIGPTLRYPLFVKPSHAGDSLGVDEHSRVDDANALAAQVATLLPEYPELLVEEYVDGREFTVLVVADPDGDGASRALAPVEFEFPAGSHFKTYALKTSELHPSANVPVRDAALAGRLQSLATRLFRAFDGVGYARMDFRMDAHGELYFLEVNFTCSVFYANGFEGSADYILIHDGMGQRGFARRIVAEGIARHARRRPRYVMQGSAVAGYGIFAAQALASGEVVFRSEAAPHRIVTRRHVESTWSEEDRHVFAQYAYPLSDEVFALWDANPSAWAPQNHSCSPNTAFDGLNVVALRAIAAGEELTLDYGHSMSEVSAPFDCRCGSTGCRGRIVGCNANSVSAREQERRRLHGTG